MPVRLGCDRCYDDLNSRYALRPSLCQPSPVLGNLHYPPNSGAACQGHSYGSTRIWTRLTAAFTGLFPQRKTDVTPVARGPARQPGPQDRLGGGAAPYDVPPPPGSAAVCTGGANALVYAPPVAVPEGRQSVAQWRKPWDWRGINRLPSPVRGDRGSQGGGGDLSPLPGLGRRGASAFPGLPPGATDGRPCRGLSRSRRQDPLTHGLHMADATALV